MGKRYIDIYESEIEKTKDMETKVDSVIRVLEVVSIYAEEEFEKELHYEDFLSFECDVKDFVDYFSDHCYDKEIARALSDYSYDYGMPDIFGIMGKLGFIGEQQERMGAWLGISRQDKKNLQPYCNVIMADHERRDIEIFFDGTTECINLNGDEKDELIVNEVYACLYMAQKYGAHVFYWRHDGGLRLSVFEANKGRFYPYSAAQARDVYKARKVAGQIRWSEKEPRFEDFKPENKEETFWCNKLYTKLKP